MPTPKQLAANRANAQKSTGPSQNAITHGLLAQSILLPNESPERFRALHTSYLNTFPPDSQETLDLIETLTVARWRLRRIWTLEAANLAYEQRAQAEANQHEDPPTQTVLALRNLSMPRACNHALDRLFKMQAANRENPAPQSAKRENIDTKPIFETNKQLTLNRKPIRSLSEASTKPQRTGVKPGSKPMPWMTFSSPVSPPTNIAGKETPLIDTAAFARTSLGFLPDAKQTEVDRHGARQRC